MIFTGQVAKPPASSYAPGANPPLAQDQFGAGFFTELNARYANLVAAGLMFGVQYASGATAAASATAAGAFSLYNPQGSGKNLVIIDIATAFASLAAGTTSLIVGAQVSGINGIPTTVTAGSTPQNLLAGAGSASIAKTYTVATTVGASTVVARVVAALYFDLAAGDTVALIKDQIDGGIIIPPGGIMNLVSVSGTPTIIPSITWAEIPA
jgi:hypothetical protein